MSFIRFLALSHLPWALIFVAALVLVARLPILERNVADAQRILAQKDDKAVARLDLAPPIPIQSLTSHRLAEVEAAPRAAHSSQKPKSDLRERDQMPPYAGRFSLLRPPAQGSRRASHAQPAFHIPDPPSDAADNLPPLLQSRKSQCGCRQMQPVGIPHPPDAIVILPEMQVSISSHHARTKQHAAVPAFSIPDPPLFDASVQGALVAARLEAGLTPEMMKNFDLFLYVSKADTGPLSQRLYVFQKKHSGQLKLLYDWAASTGREQREISPRGSHTVTTTPAGYYELDPERMYRSYRSYNWNQDMPDAMFFNWEREGLETGLAIHAATGHDIEKLGERASAGCVHLAPENAALLFDMIRSKYRGPVPRFAYDRDSQTMSNQGSFMHDPAGRLKMANGYRVLIRIENYAGGDNLVAALF